MLDNQASKRYLTCVLLFLLFAAALTGAGWHMIQSAGIEAGDFAANSLLVQDAKRLHLIVGNYSRVGFNHPGPAILYVHAFGELLFHDWLHVVPSPFAGQILASLLYNAAWMTLVFAVVRRFAGQPQALLFVAVLALVTLGIDPAIVNGMWFPHLYYFPYAAMLVSIAPLAYGRADTLKALAVSSGFLLNGHASFMPMLAVMLVVMLAANWLVSRTDRSRRILSPAWFKAHGRELAAAVFILFLFLVPLLVSTIRHYPGPLHDYVHYGRLNKGNAIPDAVRFVLVFWGEGKWRIAGLLLAFALAVRLLTARPAQQQEAAQPHDFVRSARGLGIAFIASTLALLYYAKAGVDDLSQVYVAYFYYSVPALCAALAALFVVRMIPAGGRAMAAGLAAALVLAVCWPWLRQEPVYTYNYSQPGVAELYEQLHALPGKGRIVLDLEQDQRTWGTIWGGTLGLQAYAKRQHDDLVCVNEHWHISNTHRGQCRPEEVAANRRFEVHADEAPDPARGEPDVEGQGLALYRVGVPHPPAVYTTVKEHPDYFRQVLGQGWSALEGDFVWSDGKVANIDLPADPARSQTLTLDLGAFLPQTGMSRRVEALVDGKPAGAMIWRYGDARRRFRIDLGPNPGAAKHIELRIANPIRPKDYIGGVDTRLIGLSLYGIKKDTP
jgi:hypothetical protein